MSQQLPVQLVIRSYMSISCAKTSQGLGLQNCQEAQQGVWPLIAKLPGPGFFPSGLPHPGELQVLSKSIELNKRQKEIQVFWILFLMKSIHIWCGVCFYKSSQYRKSWRRVEKLEIPSKDMGAIANFLRKPLFQTFLEQKHIIPGKQIKHQKGFPLHVAP